MSKVLSLLQYIPILAWDAGLAALNVVLPKRAVGAVVPSSCPGAKGQWPEYQPPKEGDSRSACPALNALANHGILPRNGRNISYDELASTVEEAFNFAPSFCHLVPKVFVKNMLKNKPTVDLEDLNLHNDEAIEHNASLCRRDVLHQPDQGTPYLPHIRELLSMASGKGDDGEPLLTPEDVSKCLAKRRVESRITNPEPPLSKFHKFFGCSNAATLVIIFGGKIKDLEAVLVEERLPEGWESCVREKFGLTMMVFNRMASRIEKGIDETQFEDYDPSFTFMSYISVEADERLEEGPEGLQFKSFLRADPAAGNQNTGVGNADRGYLQDHPHRKGTGGFWTLEYYQPYFDVDTTTVLKRCYTTILPHKCSNYISNYLNPPDLYGPFWTQTTLIFTIFLSSSLGASIALYFSAPGTKFDYDFQLLSLAVSFVYSYGLGIPVLLWVVLRYLGVGEWSVVEALGIWGYSLFVWIPVSILCTIPEPIMRYVLSAVAFGQSGYFLVVNIYPILATAEAKATRLIIVVVAVLHAALALTFPLVFFTSVIVKAPSGAAPGPGNGTAPATTTSPVAFLL